MMPMSEPVQVPSRREEACPGCGALLPVENGPTHPYMRSSPACWARYGEVLAREFGDPAYFALHQLVRAGAGNEQARLALLQKHERLVRAQIAELEASLDVIRGKVAAYERHVRDGTAAGVWTPTPVD